ncbi:hypothetical protein CIPAW_16G002700 [Carya illinoinensis]|uniref:Uncharacterized protein n=1 Tax=Carya illinoinensis TaxID=32201 RepID=A0A8T1N605_CARIL|nr:hypothetical protein CIPAW_16G002700 [Carya illinoinensis]
MGPKPVILQCCMIYLEWLMMRHQHFKFSQILFFQGSWNKFHGQHALRERARKIDEGIYIDYKAFLGLCYSV